MLMIRGSLVTWLHTGRLLLMGDTNMQGPEAFARLPAHVLLRPRQDAGDGRLLHADLSRNLCLR